MGISYVDGVNLRFTLLLYSTYHRGLFVYLDKVDQNPVKTKIIKD